MALLHRGRSFSGQLPESPTGGAAVVVNEERCAPDDRAMHMSVAADLHRDYVEVVVVVAGDGEVPHPAVVVPGRGSAVGGGQRAVRVLRCSPFFSLAAETHWCR